MASGKQPIADIFEAFRQATAEQTAAYGAVRAADEWAEASRGECPDARACSSSAELARWFTLAGIAAGAIARSGQDA